MKEIKKIVFVWCMTFVAVFASAQVAFGVRAGVGETSLVQKMDLKYRSGDRFGYSVAGLASIPLYKKWSLRPELAFAHQGGNYLSNRNQFGEYTTWNQSSHYSLMLPVNTALTFRISDVDLVVYAGPVLDYCLFGKLKSKDLLENTHIEDRNPKTFDLGVDLGLSVEYLNMFFSITVLSGTLDRRLSKQNEESSVYQNNVTFSLGYFFR